MFISFAWTAKVFQAGFKDVTRRYWKPVHAGKFSVGMLVVAMDKLPYRGGQNIGKIEIVKRPWQQYSGEMPLLINATFVLSISTHTMLFPSLAKQTLVTNPTRPVPTTTIFFDILLREYSSSIKIFSSI